MGRPTPWRSEWRLTRLDAARNRLLDRVQDRIANFARCKPQEHGAGRHR